MKLKNVAKIGALLAAGACMGWAFAQQGEDPAMQAMKHFEKMGQPGKDHADLNAQMLGTWDVTTKWAMGPDQPMQESKGKAKGMPSMGGRFVRFEHSGEMMGGQWEGLGYYGFNNVTKGFENWWVDSATTGMMMSTGKKIGDNQIEWTGSYHDVMTGVVKTARSITTFNSRDLMTFEMFDTTSDGKEYKSLEVSYTRIPNPKPDSLKGK